MRRIALTGGIATGKSYVREQFEKLGVPTIDADTLARQAVAPGSPGLAAVVGRFGPGILDSEGALDRRKLAATVFADDRARRDLEQIVHPAVRRAIDEWFAARPDTTPFAIADIPLLFETGRHADFDAVVVAATDPENQVRRVMNRDALSEEDARARLAAQIPIEAKSRQADYVISTTGTHAETDEQVAAVYRLLRGGGTITRQLSDGPP
jgi:dephospho-CoA kinase